MKIKGVFAMAMVFAGTVVGAGFASGLEIWTFFGRYGLAGFFGVCLCGVIISVCGAGVLLGVYNGDFKNYGEFCNCIGGKFSGKLLKWLGTGFMFSAFCVMLAGSGALFSQELGLKYSLGVFVMALICFGTFVFGANGITAVNCILTPLMLGGITILGIFNILYDCRNVSVTFSDLLTVSTPAVSTLVYVSYNLLSVPPVLLAVKTLVSNERESIAAGFSGGIVLSVSGMLMYFASLTAGFTSTQLPALTLAHKISEGFGVFYGITIYFSMLTTAVGNGFGLISEIHGWFERIPHFVLCGAVCIVCSAVSMMGFSRLVNSLYTALGYAAILLTFLLLTYSAKKLKKIWQCRSRE